MCLSAPSRVVSVAAGTAVTECFGVRREVSLILLDEPVAPGDYLLIQAGGFAYERLERARAEEALVVMETLLSHNEPARSWGEAP